jgi:hypothetical protein
MKNSLDSVLYSVYAAALIGAKETLDRFSSAVLRDDHAEVVRALAEMLAGARETCAMLAKLVAVERINDHLNTTGELPADAAAFAMTLVDELIGPVDGAANE